VAAPLGQTPPLYNAETNIDAFRHEDILRLIEFYNDDFGIVAGDGIAVRRNKYRLWMASL
jgi:hypothetical protein